MGKHLGAIEDALLQVAPVSHLAHLATQGIDLMHHLRFRRAPHRRVAGLHHGRRRSAQVLQYCMSAHISRGWCCGSQVMHTQAHSSCNAGVCLLDGYEFKGSGKRDWGADCPVPPTIRSLAAVLVPARANLPGDAVQVEREQQRPAPQARGSQRRLAPGMARAHHHHVIVLLVVPRAACARRCRSAPRRRQRRLFGALLEQQGVEAHLELRIVMVLLTGTAHIGSDFAGLCHLC